MGCLACCGLWVSSGMGPPVNVRAGESGETGEWEGKGGNGWSLLRGEGTRRRRGSYQLEDEGGDSGHSGWVP